MKRWSSRRTVGSRCGFATWSLNSRAARGEIYSIALAKAPAHNRRSDFKVNGRSPIARGVSRAVATAPITVRFDMPRFSANLSYLFTETPFLERFGEAAHAGFRAVEFSFPYDYQVKEIASRVLEHKVEVVLFNSPPGDSALGDRGLASIPGREHEFAAGIVTALRYAQALHCPRLHVMAGVLPEGCDQEERDRRLRSYTRNLRFACAEAASEGVTILIEPLNPRDVPNYLLTTQAEAHAIRTELGAANLKVQMDLYHAQIVEGDLSFKLRRWLNDIGHIQIAGVPERHEPDRGELNCYAMFDLLDELGYGGWIGCEYRPRAGTVPGLAWLDKLDGSSKAR
jgi:hydroxypyruvate isomerase